MTVGRLTRDETLRAVVGGCAADLLNDLAGMKVAAAAENAFGGYQLVAAPTVLVSIHTSS